MKTLQAFATATGAQYEVVLLGVVSRPCFYLYRWEGHTPGDRARTLRYIAGYREERQAREAAARLVTQEGTLAEGEGAGVGEG